jgi:branched-subunit amino acid transport protein
MRIESLYFWQIVAGLSVGTFFIRSFLIFLSSHIRINNRSKEILTFIPAAILPALIAPLVFFHKGQVEALHGKERLFVLILATGVSYFAKNMLITIGFGLTLLYFITQS